MGLISSNEMYTGLYLICITYVVSEIGSFVKLPFLPMCANQGFSVNCIASSFSKSDTSLMLRNLLLLDFLERNVSIHQSWHQFLQISPLSRLLSMVHYSVKCYYSISPFFLTYKNHSDVVYLRVELRY